MNIRYGRGTSEYGPGVDIFLTGDEVATAIAAYLTARDVNISGPATTRVNDTLCEIGNVYVDPSGFVVHRGNKISGRGRNDFSGEQLATIYEPEKEPSKANTVNALKQTIDIFDKQLKRKSSIGDIRLWGNTVIEMKAILNDAIKIISSKKGE